MVVRGNAEQVDRLKDRYGKRLTSESNHSGTAQHSVGMGSNRTLKIHNIPVSFVNVHAGSDAPGWGHRHAHRRNTDVIPTQHRPAGFAHDPLFFGIDD